MLDIYFRAVKDRVFEPICNIVPNRITPFHITATGFVFGLASCACAANDLQIPSVILWFFNRALDCLDGTLARHRAQSSNLGGFLDLLADFIVYSFIPIACASSQAAYEGQRHRNLWLAVALVEASFHINNFVLFYTAAVLEKCKAADAAEKLMKPVSVTTAASSSTSSSTRREVKELTSVMMRPALIEGMESGILFTVMLTRPQWTELLCWTMALLVGFGIFQRVLWLASAM